MEKGKLKEHFLSACNDIAQPLLEAGFKITEKGQRIKKKSPNKDFTYEVYFESRTYNNPGSITVCPALIIYSQKAKAYDLEHTGNPHCKGLVWSSHLGKLMPQSSSNWNVAGGNREPSITEITNAIFQYGAPIFQLFDNPDNAVKVLREKGTLFYEHMTKTLDSLRALTFMLLYGTKEDAEHYFNGYIQRCTYKSKIYELFSTLENTKNIDLNFSEFWDANLIKRAYVAGLNIWNSPNEKGK